MQVSLTLIWVEHPTATSTSKFNFRERRTYSVWLLTVYAGRVIWQETDLFHPHGWLKALYIILDHGACVRRIQKKIQRDKLWKVVTPSHQWQFVASEDRTVTQLQVRSIVPTDYITCTY